MSEVDANVYLVAVEGLVTFCLQKLLQIGHINPDDVNGKWHIELDTHGILEISNFQAGAILDENDRVILFLRPQLDITFDELKQVIAHETIHLAQICKGDLVPRYGKCIWKGTSYELLSAYHPDYFRSQPWEMEVQELQPLLLEHLTRHLTG